VEGRREVALGDVDGVIDEGTGARSKEEDRAKGRWN